MTHARQCRLGVAFAALAVLTPAGSCVRTAQADTVEEIQVEVQTALRRFRARVENASELLAQADGVLVIPEVKKVGFVLGAQWGQGALFVDGLETPAAYYRMAAGSVGFQAGYKEAAYIYLFLTEEVLRDFRAGDTWTADVDASVTVIDDSFGGSTDALRKLGPVIAYVLGEQGLMGGVSVSGTMFTRLR